MSDLSTKVDKAYRASNRLKDPLGRGRKLGEQSRRPDRPGAEVTTAIGTGTAEPCLHAVGAEGTLKGADPSVSAVERQVAITAFAIGAQGKHGNLLGDL